MKIEIWAIGKTQDAYIQTGLDHYLKKLKHYLPVDWQVWPDVRSQSHWSPEQFKQKEGELILEKLKPGDWLVLLDENGRQFTSEGFAIWMEQLLNLSCRRLIFLIGGAYGFSTTIYERADAQLALSKMTFSHQMVRLFFLEQLYRGMSILRNEPYHNK